MNRLIEDHGNTWRVRLLCNDFEHISQSSDNISETYTRYFEFTYRMDYCYTDIDGTYDNNILGGCSWMSQV